MKTKHAMLMLFMGISISTFAEEVTGKVPSAGETAYLYNVGQGKYLTATANGFTLSETGTEFTLTAVSGSTDTYQLTDGSAVVFSTSFNSQVFYSTIGDYDQWKFTKTEASDVYNLVCMEDDAFAYSQVYWSNVTNSLEKSQTLSSLANAQWKLTDAQSVVEPEPDPEPEPETVSEVTFYQSSETFAVPENMAETVTVKFDRTSMIANKRSSFCVPFDMTYAQCEAIFGKTVRIYEFSRNVGTRVYYSYTSKIKAGVPYVIQPTKVRDGDYYVVENVKSSSFVSEPLTVDKGTFTFYGTFVKMIPAPLDMYTYNNGTFYHYAAATSISGFRGYFLSNEAGVKITGEFVEDEETGIIDLNKTESLNQPIYNVNGQMVRTNDDSVEGLAPGIYVINGKKVVLK